MANAGPALPPRVGLRERRLALGTHRTTRWFTRMLCGGTRRWALAMAVHLAAVLAATVPAAAQAPAPATTPEVVTAINFEGTVHSNPAELLARVTSRVGEPLSAAQVTEDVKTLFRLGYFKHVRAEAQEVPGRGYELRFVVTEKPRIVAVVLRGNTQVSDKDLYKALTLHVGAFYDPRLGRQEAEAIKAAYRKEGYLKAKVTAELEQVAPLEGRLVLHIEEAPRQYITRIEVQGTQVFTGLEVERMMQSAEVDCFSWLNAEGNAFDEERINQDLQVIVARYLELGYVRVFIEKPKVTLIHTDAYSMITVELNITEGAQYFAGKLDISGDILGDKQTLIDAFGLESGDVYNVLQQSRDTFALRQIYQEQGYAFVQVRPDTKIDDERHIVDVTYQIAKGDKAYIGRIEFRGNSTTRDFVLRREFKVQEDELYNGSALREAQQRLMALGFFDPAGLNVETRPREIDNVLDVVTEVKEAQTGTLQAQLSYSEQGGMALGATVSKGNFLGRGQTIRGSLRWSQRGTTRDVSVDFIEPHLFGSEFSSDSSLSFRTVEDQTELDLGTSNEVSATQGFGHPIIGPLSINLAVSALNRDYEDPDLNDLQLRTFTTSLIYDTVNHPVFPSAGSNITLSASQIGGVVLGGSTEYRRYRLRAQRFFALNDDNTLILMGRLRLGWLETVGNNVIPPEERFRLGGSFSLRGYRSNEVGGPYGALDREINGVEQLVVDANGQPVLDANGNPIYRTVDKRTLGFNQSQLDVLAGGGIFERVFNLEMLFPLAGNAFRGVIFYDAGQVNAESEQYQVLGEEEPGFLDVLHSVGAGIRMITPLGVFRLEYGVKLKRRPGESPDEYDFTISTLF